MSLVQMGKCSKSKVTPLLNHASKMPEDKTNKILCQEGNEIKIGFHNKNSEMFKDKPL